MKIPFDVLERAIHSNDYIGFCLACGEEAHGVEPDARSYKCESCGECQVYGAEEILLMGLAGFPDEKTNKKGPSNDE